MQSLFSKGFWLILGLLLLPSPLLANGLEDLSIGTAKGILAYHIETAITEVEQEKGLMGRGSLPANQGMLFILSPEQDVSMWMKNTPISLDMLFIDANGVIIFIKHDAKPNSLDVISSHHKVRAVLELAGGSTHRDHIAIGDRVLHPAFTASGKL